MALQPDKERVRLRDAVAECLLAVAARALTVVVVDDLRGKPLVRVAPVREEKTPTRLEGAITYEADDIFSTGETFEAAS